MKRIFLFSLALMMLVLLNACSALTGGDSVTPTSAPTAIPAPSPTATAAPTPEPAETPASPEVKSMQEKNDAVWREMHERDWMEGRLVIPAAGIDVALFNWGAEPVGDYSTDKLVEVVRQAVVDNEDSALLYYDDTIGNIIADHSNQDFSALYNVQVGDSAYILSGDRMVTLRCSFTEDGINTGYGITDADGSWDHDGVDYVCYTCLEDWTHIRIVGFETVNEEFLNMDWIDVAGASSSSSSSGGSAVTTSISVPAPTSTAVPEATATPAPSASPEPQPAQQVNAQPVQPEPDNYDTIPGYDIYANNDTYGNYGYAGGDIYLS